ncbi:MAG: trigger factor [Coriobacteriales bacterium]|jgi:trigger factor|nr:trigger factor [Coriobacteriales bacterium]
MKIKKKAPQDGRVHMQITATPAEVDNAQRHAVISLAYQNKLQQKPTFDELKADVITTVGEPMFNAYLDNFVMNFLAPFAITQENIPAALTPQVSSEMTVAAGKDYSFNAVVTLQPTYELSSYEPVSITLPTVAVAEEEIDQQLLMIAENNATYKKDADRAVVNGDNILIAIKTVDGKGEPLPGLTADSRMYTAGQGYMPEEFDRQIEGMNVGETKTFDVTGPDLNEKGEQTESTYTFTVTIKEIQKRVVPAITDAWVEANMFGLGVKTVAEFREKIREQGMEAKNKQLEQMRIFTAASELAKRFKGKIADEFYEHTRSDLMANIQQQLQRQGQTLQEYLKAQGTDEQQFGMSIMLQTREVLTQGFSLDALARHLKLAVDETDIEEAFRLMAPGHEKEVRAEFEGTGRMYQIREAALRTKANKWLVETAEITYQ